MVIGVSGVAGAGKDTFFRIFQGLLKNRKVIRFALADALKKECSKWTLPYYGIDALNCTREDKELIREFLVFHAKYMRDKTEGRHWIAQLHEELLPFVDSDDIAIVTDVRFGEYGENDEINWIKNKLNGILVHVSMYEAHSDSNEGVLYRNFIPPANEEEFKNDPLLKENADYLVEWPKVEEKDFKNPIQHHVESFIKHFNI